MAIIAFKAVGLATSLLEIGSAVGKAVIALKGLGGASVVNPIVLIAIALLGAALALDDIQGYTRGKDSLLGSMLDNWDEESGKLNFMRTLLAQILADLGLLSRKHRIAYGFDEPSDFVRNLGNKLRKMIDWRLMLITPLAPILFVIHALRAAWQTWAADVGTAITGAITTAWTAVVSFVERSLALIRDKATEMGRSVIGGATSGARSILPTWIADRVLPAAASPSASRSSSLSLTSGPVTVNASTGASPAEIGRAVQQAQQDGLLPMLRNALRNLAPAEE